MKNKKLEEIREMVLLEGLQEGTEVFDKRFKQVQILKCREMKGVFACNECKFFDYCELVKSAMKDHRGY